MNKISASVGRNSTNHSADVALVQKLLNAQKIQGVTTPLKVDGTVDNKTNRESRFFRKKF
ncbi:MAG: hypothetical protein V3V31_08505 [Methylococcales bacterium]